MADINLTPDQYREILYKLAPQGRAWPSDPDSTWYKFLDAIAQELSRINGHAYLLSNEAFPSTTVNLLPNWERIAGLPDECSELGETIEVRRLNLLTKLTAVGGQSINYLVDLVNYHLGYEIEITEYRPFQVDKSSMGESLGDEEWWYVFLVTAPEVTIRWFRSGIGAAGEPLATWGNERLECLINKYKPAHTHAIFAYV